MSRENPGNIVSSASDIARLAPGHISPPTYLRKVEPFSRSAAPPAIDCQRQSAPNAGVCERLLAGVEDDKKVAYPRALRRRDTVAGRLDQLCALGPCDASALGPGAAGFKR